MAPAMVYAIMGTSRQTAVGRKLRMPVGQCRRLLRSMWLRCGIARAPESLLLLQDQCRCRACYLVRFPAQYVSLPLLPNAAGHVGIGASIDKFNPASEAERIQLTLAMSFTVGLVCATMGVLRFALFWRTSPLACKHTRKPFHGTLHTAHR